jgi:hypothetical protein
MVLVEVNGNFIEAEPIKNKSAGSMIKAYLALWKQLTASGMVKPTKHLLDNKASEEFKAEIRKKLYNPTHTSRQPPTKSSRTSHPNLHKSLQSNISRSG